MAKEIERKFLLRNADWKVGKPGQKFRQGYLSSDPQRVVRVRLAGDKAMLTVKGITRGNSRLEFEYPIPVADADQLLDELCEKPLGARDYLAIAARFDTLFLDHIPVMGQDRRNEAKRFILLVDTLYDNRVRLVASAEAAPEALYRGTTGVEVFEFARTASRLTEMQSREWLDGARQQDAAQ